MIEKGAVRDYFPRYQSLWAEMRRAPGRKGVSHGFHASYLDTHLLVSIVPEEERELFAANMYGHGLLAQVFHTFVRPEGFVYPRGEDAQNAFPAVCGVLSTAWSHVCPAVMPSILLYWSPWLLLEGFTCRDRDLEQRLWIGRGQIFDAGRDAICGKIVPPTVLLTGREDWDWEKLFLRYFTEHGHLKERVVNRDDTDRVVNQQP